MPATRCVVVLYVRFLSFFGGGAVDADADGEEGGAGTGEVRAGAGEAAGSALAGGSNR